MVPKHIAKYIMTKENFRPFLLEGIRWLVLEGDFELMKEFWNMNQDDWNKARELGYTYCAIIVENRIASVAAVWKYSEEKWEVAAVNTRAEFLNRGFAKRVVSFATEYVIANNKTPTISTDANNMAMRKVAESIGYHLHEIETKP